MPRSLGAFLVLLNGENGQFDVSRGEGGGIFNRGDVIVDGEASFTGNRGMVSQALHVLYVVPAGPASCYAA